MIAAIEPDDLAALREAVLHANTDESKSSAYRRYFGAMTRGQLERATEDLDLGIALQAAWEVAKSPKRRVPAVEGRAEWTYDPRRLDHFVDRLQARTGVPVPGWWRVGVRQVDLFPGQHHAFIGVKLPDDLVEDSSGLRQRSIRLSQPLSGHRRNVAFHVGDLSIPEGLFETDAFGEGLRALQTNDALFVAIYPFAAYPYRLNRIDLPSKKLRWSADVWAARRGPFGGQGYHYTSLVLSQQRIVVFGMESHGAYAEGFDAVDGHPVFRFCSCYWFNFSEAWKPAPGSR